MIAQALLRAGWVKYSLLLALLACGGAFGLYLSGALPDGRTAVPAPAYCDTATATPARPITQRFSLTTRDSKDTIEAPSLAADSADRVFLTWASKTGDAERTVFFSRTIDGGLEFDAPKVLSKGGVYRSPSQKLGGGYERMATPHVAVVGKSIHVTWSEAAKDGSKMPLLLATSTDAGNSFEPARPVHQHFEASPNFTAMGVGPNGELACAWLDSQKPVAAVRPAGALAFEDGHVVHQGEDGKGVCPCCATATCFAPDGTLLVAFRNIADGYRDMAVGVLRPGQSHFEPPFPVVPPTWKFNGCPHDGPSIVVLGERVHIVWMDARSGSPRCYYARAKLADMVFTSEELHAIPFGMQGNAKLLADAKGRLHVVWEETSNAPPAGSASQHQHGAPTVTPGVGGRAIQYATLVSDGHFGPPHAVAPRAGAFQTRPTLAVTSSGRVFVAWNELDENGKSLVVTSFSDIDQIAHGGRP